MNRRSILAAVSAFATFACVVPAGHAVADTVSLPYQSADTNGNQWTVFFNGNLQQQGNQPVFSQAGMITVNGSQPQRNNQTANYDDKAKELTVSFTVRNGTYQHTRRIRFDDGGIVRIMDVFDNPADADTTLTVNLMTNTNFGVNDTQLITDPKHKDVSLGWAANTGAERAAMSLYAGKGAKVTPKLRYQPNNNSVNAAFSVKVPAKGKAVLVHWHGTFDNADAANTWAQQLKENKQLADLSADVRKAVVNVGGIGGGLIGGMDLLRGTTRDVIELRGGDLMRGDLKADAYTLATGYGDVTLPAAKVAGLLSVGDYPPRQLLVTTDGEVFGGVLSVKSIPITLGTGQATQVPLGQIARVGVRIPSGDPPEWKLDQPMAFLASGERCLIAPPTEPIDFLTRYGPLKLSPDQLSAVLLSPSAASHQVYLSDGSRLTGVLTRAAWDLKLTSTTADKPVSFPLATLARVQVKPLAEGTGANMPTLGLLGDDLVSARLETPIKLQTAFDTLELSGPEITSIARPQPGQPDVQVTTFDGSTFRGSIVTPTLTVTLASGPTLTVPVSAVRDYQNPRPYPAAAVVDKAKDAVGRLNGDDWKAREAAEAELTAMGPSISGVLEAALPGQPPEAQDRINGILKKFKKDQPATPTRLTPPPPLEQ